MNPLFLQKRFEKNFGGTVRWLKNTGQLTPEIEEAIVRHHGMGIYHVRQTPELVLLAVANYGGSLKYVKREFKTSEVCLTAVKEHREAIKYVPGELLMSHFEEFLDAET